MRMVFVGGGTGGHFYPLIAIAEAIRVRDADKGTETELFYMGPDAFNTEVLASHDIEFVYCPAGKQRVYKSILNYFDFFKILIGVFVAFYKLLILYPDVVMSKGGYTSVPVVFAAWILRIPIVIHESDALPGRANVFAARFARYIAVAHDDVAKYFPEDKVALVGMPVRSSFFTEVPNPHEVVGIPSDRTVILVTGGSQGAERINNLILNTLPQLLQKYTIIHQAGDTHAQKISETASSLITDQELLSHYFVLGHMSQEKFAAAQQAASIIISRAGSGTLFEAALRGKPSIIIPIPEDISRDQRTNAYAYASGGAASVIEERNLSDDILIAELTRILENKETYAEMSQAAKSFTVDTAAYTLADTLRAIGHEHE